MTEDDMLNRITVEQLLNRLPPHHAELIRMIEKIDQPLDYTGPWPATYEDIGVLSPGCVLPIPAPIHGYGPRICPFAAQIPT
jgi:hypothetical protein